MLLRLFLICLTLLSAQLTTAESHADEAPPPEHAQVEVAELFGVALVKTEASADFNRAVVVDGKTVYANGTRGLTLRDVSAVSLKKDEKGSPELLIQWTAEGAKTHEAFTAAHVGEMLVFLIKGKAVKMVKITEKISGDRLALHLGQFDQAEALVAEITARLQAGK